MTLPGPLIEVTSPETPTHNSPPGPKDPGFLDRISDSDVYIRTLKSDTSGRTVVPGVPTQIWNQDSLVLI